jgi:hypothetical protein
VRVEAESAGAGDRLTRLIGLATQNSGFARLEIAIRAWAKTDDRVAIAVAEIDRQRVDYIASLLRELGIEARTARLRALIVYLAAIGSYFTQDSESRGADRALWTEVQRLILQGPRRTR